MPGQTLLGKYDYARNDLENIILGNQYIPERGIYCPPVHCYLQLINHSLIDDQEWKQKIQENIWLLKELKIPIILGITKYDEIIQALNEDPFAESDRTDEFRNEISRLFELNCNFTKIIINYHEVHTNLNFSIDINLYCALLSCMFQGRTRIRSKYL